MIVSSFLNRYQLHPDQIPGEACLARLLSDMEQGLQGRGNIPMLPSYLSASLPVPKNTSCCVLDAGGTNFRSAKASFDALGNCGIDAITRIPMPGTHGAMDADCFYQAIAAQAQNTCCTERIGFCFSYNVQMNPDLDGTLLSWCKEVQVPGAIGKPVGAKLREALGHGCESVHVLNDSVAAMLGASTPEQPVQVGIILGTGINVCYEEQCHAIEKLDPPLHKGGMIISTEVGEFDGIPKSPLDLALFAATEDPDLAHSEKQCAGGYLGDLICRAWQEAAREQLLPEEFLHCSWDLPQISRMLEFRDPAMNREAQKIAEVMIHRGAKIAAILCAGPVLRCTADGNSVTIAVEGSQYEKLWHFREYFTKELALLLAPRNITFSFVQTDNACLKGAAMAAFAQTY